MREFILLEVLDVEGCLCDTAANDLGLRKLIELFVEAEHVNTELQVNVQQDQLLDAGWQLLHATRKERLTLRKKYFVF